MKAINWSNIIYVVGIGLIFESIFMIFPVLISYFSGEPHHFPLYLSFFITLSAGLAAFGFTRKKFKSNPHIRQGFMAVTAIWIMMPLFGTLPYLITGMIPRFADALFESVSGFTTTGSSILTHIEAMPRSLLFWRAETHWIGGMGIIVLVIAVIPHFRAGARSLLVSEGSLFGIDKFKPKFIEVAKRLWIIYFVLTFAQIIALRIAGMNLFDAVCHAFATIATGGFSTKDTSLAGYSPAIQYITTFFMFLAGMNFSLHYLFVHGKFKAVFRNEELRVYTALILTVSLIITFLLFTDYHDIEKSFRLAAFQVVSIITATGFATADYETWPHMAKILMFVIMFAGASIGSTGGGIKIARYVVFFKAVRKIIRDKVVKNIVQGVKMNGKILDQPIVFQAMIFIALYYLTFFAGSVIMVGLGNDAATSVSSVITTMGGIGPGFGAVGPTENFYYLNDLSKYYLDFSMIIGRLEIYPVISLFLPLFYKI